jgi:hypothetical protein
MLATFRPERGLATLAPMSSTGTTHWRELARRTGNGVEIALLCNDLVNRIKVVVADDSLCHHLDFELEDAEAVNAFRQPFADATAQLLARAR